MLSIVLIVGMSIVALLLAVALRAIGSTHASNTPIVFQSPLLQPPPLLPVPYPHSSAIGGLTAPTRGPTQTASCFVCASPTSRSFGGLCARCYNQRALSRANALQNAAANNAYSSGLQSAYAAQQQAMAQYQYQYQHQQFHNQISAYQSSGSWPSPPTYLPSGAIARSEPDPVHDKYLAASDLLEAFLMARKSDDKMHTIEDFVKWLVEESEKNER